MTQDDLYMKRALDLARKGVGRTSPNPHVGAVIVKNGRIIGEGYHRKAGMPHAEAVALARAGAQAAGGTIYVTLEPCCHTEKRTPPCAQAIVHAGLKRAVIAVGDPNPRVSGRGIRLLRRAGIDVRTGVLAREARRLNQAFFYFIKTGRPFVTLKVAQSLDGRIATASGQSQWITGPSARKIVHRLRSESDAIMVGIGTVKADNPSLTARISGGRNPVRIIVDGRLDIPLDSKVLDTREAVTLVATCAPEDHPKRRAIEECGAHVISIPGRKGKLDLRKLMEHLGDRQITSLLLEGGSGINGAALRSGIVQRVIFFVAMKLIGGTKAIPAVGGSDLAFLEEATRLGLARLSQAGSDIVIEADVLS